MNKQMTEKKKEKKKRGNLTDGMEGFIYPNSPVDKMIFYLNVYSIFT
jgi:hypothetical protein